MGYFKGIKIDKDGNLWLKRKGRWKEVYCPICPLDMQSLIAHQCGTWCARFGEPSVDLAGTEKVYLPICHDNNVLICDVNNFIDEREEDNASNKNQTQKNNG